MSVAPQRGEWRENITRYDISREEVRCIGRDLAAGVMPTVTAWVLWIVFVTWVSYVALGLTGWSQDDSDRDAWHRSGLRILTDHKTGVQYLSRGGALTPRLDGEGRIVREGEVK